MENTRRADYLLPRHASRILATALLALSLSGCGPSGANGGVSAHEGCSAGSVSPFIEVNSGVTPQSEFAQNGCAVEGTVSTERDGKPDNNCKGAAVDNGRIVDLNVQLDMEQGDLVTVTAHDAQVQAACYPTSFGIGEFLQTQGQR